MSISKIKCLIRMMFTASAIAICASLLSAASFAQRAFPGSGSFRGPVLIEMQDENLSYPYDKYETVKFRHKWHAEIVKDCTICHHHFDKHMTLARETGANRQQSEKCTECHSGGNPYSQYQAIPCSVCHETEYSRTNLERVGLKGAIHRLCIDCHVSASSGPIECMECHVKNVPDHAVFVKKYEGSKTCDECHPGKSREVMNSTHYKLMSRLPLDYLYTNDDATERTTYAQSGFIFYYSPFWATLPQLNWLYIRHDDPSTPEIDNVGGCGVCHIGYGRMPYTTYGGQKPSYGEEDNVDCLVCHSPTYERKYFQVVADGKPVEVDGKPLLRAVPITEGIADYSIYTSAAREISHTKTDFCQRCHGTRDKVDEIVRGGEYGFKRGVEFTPATDVHAAIGISCSECHYVSKHEFRRKLSSDLLTYSSYRYEEGCLDCHRFVHINDKMKDMVAKVSCTSCHAASKGGVLSVDYSLANRSAGGYVDVPVTFADKEWHPEFRWFNRKVKAPTYPLGTRFDGMLYPYKVLTVTYPVDKENNPITVSHESLFIDGNIEKAAAEGRKDYGRYIRDFKGDISVFGLPVLADEMTGFATSSFMYTFSHGISKAVVRQCVDCHGSNSMIDWNTLGLVNPNPIG